MKNLKDWPGDNQFTEQKLVQPGSEAIEGDSLEAKFQPRSLNAQSIPTSLFPGTARVWLEQLPEGGKDVREGWMMAFFFLWLGFIFKKWGGKSGKVMREDWLWPTSVNDMVASGEGFKAVPAFSRGSHQHQEWLRMWLSTHHISLA